MHRRLRQQAIVALAAVFATASAPAFVFQLGEVQGSFDTTLSIGGLYRLKDPSPAYYGVSNNFNGVPGQQRSVNADDGNLNYDQGLASFLLKANHDLQLDYKNVGVFVRGFYFYDNVNADQSRRKIALSEHARSIVAEGGELLDAYLYFRPTIGDMPARFAIGKQVLSWGESTFIPNGINSVNPIDVAKLRLPGAELKEALRPINMVSASLGLSENVTMEAFYLLDWERTRVDPPGTYFSTNDFVAKGGSKVFLGFGSIPDSSGIGAITRGTDNEPGSSGQWGVNLRYTSNFNNTEFGLYYMNYHSRLPAISAMTPTQPVNPLNIVNNTAAALQANATFMGGLVAASTAAGVPPATALQVLIGASLGDPTATATLGVLTPLQGLLPTVAGASGQFAQLELLTRAATGRYLIEFPEDIHLWGGSFNTNIGGIAIQGELSYRSNQPLQVDDVELLFAALSSPNSRFNANQLGTYGLNTYVQGYRRHKVWTGQMTATRVSRGILGSDQTTLLGEIGFVKADLPAKSTLRYDGAGTFLGGNLANMTTAGGIPLAEPPEAFADKISWGYQLVGRLDYNNAFKGVNMSPLIVFAHDVDGNTPLPMGNFITGRKSLTLGADFTYQNAWAVELRYVNFLGAGRYNLLGDRDYVSATLKYSF